MCLWSWRNAVDIVGGPTSEVGRDPEQRGHSPLPWATAAMSTGRPLCCSALCTQANRQMAENIAHSLNLTANAHTRDRCPKPAELRLPDRKQ